MFVGQSYDNKNLILVIDEQEYSFYKKELNEGIEGYANVTVQTIDLYKRNDKSIIVESNPISAKLFPLMADVEQGGLVSLIAPNEKVLADHYSSLVRAFEDDETLDVAYSDVLLTHKDSSDKKFFDMRSQINPFNDKHNDPVGMSRILFKIKSNSWMKSTLPYLDWCFVEAIFAKAEIRQRVSRASCTIDIQNLMYKNRESASFDAEILMDSMNSAQKKTFLLERLDQQGLTEAELRDQVATLKSKKIKFNTYSIEERQEIIAHLLESLHLPNWFMSLIRKSHSFFWKKNRTR